MAIVITTVTTTTTATKRGTGGQLQLMSESVASDTGGGLAKLPFKANAPSGH